MDDEVDYEEVIKEFGFKEVGKTHRQMVFEHPLAAWKAKKLGQEVRDDIVPRRLPGGKDDEADAFRHALWSYKMTKEFGADIAKEMSDAYERGTYNRNSKGQRLMDLHNNKAGRELALNPYAKKYKDEKVVESALRDGILKTRPYNVKGELPLHMKRRDGFTATGRAYGK